VEHTLKGQAGGLNAIMRFKILCVTWLPYIVWGQVQKEPIVCEASHDDLSSGDTIM